MSRFSNHEATKRNEIPAIFAMRYETSNTCYDDS